jgi:hypothetical protein
VTRGRRSLRVFARSLTAVGLPFAVLSSCTTGVEGPEARPSPETPSTPTSAAPEPGRASPSEKSGDEQAETDPREPQGPRIRAVPPRQWQAMQAAGMVRPECPIARRSQLRRVDLDYVDFRGQIRRGHLIVNADTATSVARIFTRLFEARFPIRRMHGVERYDGDTLRSLRADNTSAYNCRRADQINAPFGSSPHANGRAVDINPRENPWMDLRCDCWSPSAQHAARTPGPGKVRKGGIVWRAFVEEGWVWQNIDVPDYMHFDTGYPSRPYRRPRA